MVSQRRRPGVRTGRGGIGKRQMSRRVGPMWRMRAPRGAWFAAGEAWPADVLLAVLLASLSATTRIGMRRTEGIRSVSRNRICGVEFDPRRAGGDDSRPTFGIGVHPASWSARICAAARRNLSRPPQPELSAPPRPPLPTKCTGPGGAGALGRARVVRVLLLLLLLLRISQAQRDQLRRDQLRRARPPRSRCCGSAA